MPGEPAIPDYNTYHHAIDLRNFLPLLTHIPPSVILKFHDDETEDKAKCAFDYKVKRSLRVAGYVSIMYVT